MERVLRPLPLLGLAFAVRAALAAWTWTLGADGAFHLLTAQGLLEGRFGELLGTYNLHPLNPALTAGAAWILGGLEAGGAAVGALFSSLALLPLFALTRRFWNATMAGWAGLFYALHPTLVYEGTEVLNTGTYLCFFLSTLALGVFALETRRVSLFALAGVSAGLLYLTRPEGLLVPFFLVLMALGRVRDGGRRLLAGALLAGALGLLVAAPYLLWLRSHTGRWTLTARPAARILAAEAAPPGERDERPYYRIFKAVSRAQFPPLLPLLVLGLVRARRYGGTRRDLAWASVIAAGVVAPSALLLLKSGTVNPSHRYYLPAVCLFLPWTAAGLLAVRDLCGRFGAAPLALVFGLLFLKDVGPRRSEERTLREAGAWIRANAAPADGLLVSRGEKIAWYAGLKPTGLETHGGPDATVPATLEILRREGATLLALDGPSAKRYFPPDVDARLQAAGLQKIASFEREGCESVWIWRKP